MKTAERQTRGTTGQTAKPISARSRQREAVGRATQAMQRFLQQASVEEIEKVADSLETVTRTDTVTAEQEALVAGMTGGKVYTPAEKVALEVATLRRYFEWRRELLTGALTTAQVAELLGTSRQTPHDRMKAGTLLALREKEGLRFPPWQFDADGPNGIVAGLPEILKTLSFVPPLTQASWLSLPHRLLNDETPIAALRKGKIQEVYRLAQVVGSV